MLLLPACSSGPAQSTDTVDIVAELTSPGPWGVGYTTSELSYDDDATGEERTLRLALWYPSEDEDGDDAMYADFYEAEGVWADAEVAGGTFPLAVFSHGHQGYAENSGFLMEHLASHGWVVAAPDHTGNTTFDDAERTTEIYFRRPRDISAVLDAFPLAGSVAEGPVLAIGHSFGGYTVFALAGAAYDMDTLTPACADGTGPSSFCSTMTPAYASLFAEGFADERLGAFVAMAPGDSELFGTGLAAITAPFLHMTATGDQGPGSEGDTIWDGLDGNEDAVRVVLDGGGHQSFTDWSDVLEDVPLDAEESFRIVDAYVLAMGRHMLGDTSVSDVLSGTAAVSDHASVFGSTMAE